MTSPDMKICQHCGAEFHRSRGDSTVNCPAHRTAESRRSASPARAVSRDDFYNLGKADGRKNGHKPGFSGYRNAAFTWDYAKLAPYEAGFKDGRAEVSA